MVFDRLSAAYGWTTEYIWTRTMREITWRLMAIQEREFQDASFQAKIHGAELARPLDMEQPKRLDEATEDAIAKHLEMRRAEKAREANSVNASY